MFPIHFSGYHVLSVEGDPRDDAVSSLVRQNRRILDAARPTAEVRRALEILKAITSARPRRGDTRPGQDGLEQLAAVLGALHAGAQRQVPLWGALAGLPNLLGRAAKAKSYAERMFTVAELGPLDRSAAITAVKDPAAELGVSFSGPALGAIATHADGYPYFLQTWAYHTWNIARDDPISEADVTRAGPAVRRTLDDGFFAARIARVPESERRYLRALASLGPGPHPPRAVAAALGTTTTSVGALRDRLITDGAVYSPAYGLVALALPLLDDYLRRAGY